ncbi:MAG: molybdenum cofactor biosynthesis protein MoaE [Gammaproteobacteria bacterium]
MFSISDQPIDPAALESTLDDAGAGARVVFEGRVRNFSHGRPVTRLEYEAHAGMAAKEGERVLAEACEKFTILHALAIHRVGALEIGECAIWVGVSAAHRDAAFSACRYVIDELKARLPIWKKEHYADGDSGWVGCEHDSHGVTRRFNA